MIAVPFRKNPQEEEPLKKFYVASSFRNIANVRYLSQALESKGFLNTYDWTRNGPAHAAGTATLEELRSIGQREKDAVTAADVVVLLLPGGKSTHVELGIAIALGKRTILHVPEEVLNNPETTSTFYLLPEVEKSHGSLDDLLARISSQEGAAALG